MARRLVLREPQSELEVEHYTPTPPGDSQIQVRVLATSLNHLDWKRIDKNLFIPSLPHVFGMDMAGQVSDAGKSHRFKEGDVILAPGTVGYSDGCSYQTYALVHEDHCAKIDEDVPILEASTIPFSLATAACALYLSAGLSRVADDPGTKVLIWGANGGVGKLAVQLAKVSGYSVIAVTSNEDTMAQAKARGADHVFANTDPDVVAKVHAVAPQLHHAFDTVVGIETISKIVDCCGKPATVVTATKYLGQDIKGVKIVPVYGGEVMGKTPTGQTSTAGLEIGKWLWGNLNQWLKERKISPVEHERIEGLEGVNDGLRRMKGGTARSKLALYVE